MYDEEDPAWQVQIEGGFPLHRVTGDKELWPLLAEVIPHMAN